MFGGSLYHEIDISLDNINVILESLLFVIAMFYCMFLNTSMESMQLEKGTAQAGVDTD